VASPPWQLGPFVAYQLDSAFRSFLTERNCATLDSLNIPEDGWCYSPQRQTFSIYKKLEKIVAWFARHPLVSVSLSDTTLQKLPLLNPHYYNAHKILGDYYASRHRPAEALSAYNKALQCAIPDKRIRLGILKSLKALEQ
jgi:hypothetical protein